MKKFSVKYLSIVFFLLSMTALTGCNAIGELLGSAVKNQQNNQNNQNQNNNLTDNQPDNQNNNNNNDSNNNESNNNSSSNNSNNLSDDGYGLKYRLLGKITDPDYFKRVGVNKTSPFYLQHYQLPTSAQSQVNDATEIGILLVVRDAKYNGYTMNLVKIEQVSGIYKMTVNLVPDGNPSVPPNTLIVVNRSDIDKDKTLYRIETTDGEVLFPKQFSY